MERVKVESSNVVSVGHDGQNLEVEFKGGAVCVYYDVPARVYDVMMKADSVGKYLNEHIKKAGYKYEKVS